MQYYMARFFVLLVLVTLLIGCQQKISKVTQQKLDNAEVPSDVYKDDLVIQRALIPKHTDYVRQFAFNPDEKWVISASRNKTVEVGDLSPYTVGKWHRKVFSFKTRSISGNPFEIEISATFTHTDSGTELILPGYYDGNNIWKVGFMPTKVGIWTYKTSSPNKSLSNHTGRMKVAASGHKGLLAKDSTYPDKWRYADGPYVVPIGVFVNAMLEDAALPTFTAMADFLKNNNLHLLNFRLSENDRAFENMGSNTMHLARWQRLERRMEVLTERGLGVDVMLYTDDSGKPSFGSRSA